MIIISLNEQVKNVLYMLGSETCFGKNLGPKMIPRRQKFIKTLNQVSFNYTKSRDTSKWKKIVRSGVNYFSLFQVPITISKFSIFNF